MWQPTPWGKGRFVGLEEYLFGKSQDFIEEGSSFVLPAMGEGHFYIEGKHIYYNPSHRKSYCDGAVAEWVE